MRKHTLNSFRKKTEELSLQGLKPNASKAVMSELKLRPPNGDDFSRSL